MNRRVLGAPWLAALILIAAPAHAAEPPPTGPLDVEEAVRIALLQNHAYLQEVAAEGLSAGSRMDALAGILPLFGGNYTWSKRDGTTTLQDFAVLRDAGTDEALQTRDIDLNSASDNNSFGFSAREDLSLTGWYNYRGAAHDLDRARYNSEAAAQSLAYTVRNQFYVVLRARDLQGVQEEDLRLARDQERRIQSMFELGSVARVDVLKAQVRVADAEVALIRQRNAVDIETTRLATLLGFTPDTPLTLNGDLAPRPAALDSVAAVAEALVRPDVQMAEAGLRSASALHTAAVLSRLPGLFATFNVGTQGGHQESDELDAQVIASDPPTIGFFPTLRESDVTSDGWTVTAGAAVTLDALLNSGGAKRTGAQKKQAELALEAAKLSVQQEVEEALLNLRASMSAITSAETGVQAAEEDLRLSEERYQQGLGTVLELLEAQVNLTRARSTLVLAQTALKMSEAALDKARGAPLPQ